MPFIVFDNHKDSGEGGEVLVRSVNGKIGDVILNYDDVGAISNILNSCSGVQIGLLEERPVNPDHNTVFITTNTDPNLIYRYDNNTQKWLQIATKDVLWDSF